ncbi:MAG: hypothetical protein LC437_10085, partial [Thiohalomonas sp.]|nr:hypothetical protein [Thiohalomonas sp.]
AGALFWQRQWRNLRLIWALIIIWDCQLLHRNNESDFYTHASWLNMVEIEIGNMNQQCLNRRMEDRAFLITELAAWESQQNQKKATINWMFNVDGARSKLTRAYDKLIGQN